LLGLLEDDATTLDRLLLLFGVPRPIVYGLPDGHLVARRQSQPGRAGRIVRHVLAVGQTQTSAQRALTLMSVEDYADGFAVRGRFDSTLPRINDAIRLLKLTAADDLGRVYACERTAIAGFTTADGWAMDVAWTSTRELDSIERVLALEVPGVECSFSLPLSAAKRTRHA